MEDQRTDDPFFKFKEAFRLVDEDGDGYITTEELKKLLELLGYPYCNKLGEESIIEIDELRKDRVNLDWFLYLIHGEKAIESEESLKETFQNFDKDQNGFISATELREFVASCDMELTHEEVDEMMYEADLDCDGQLSYEEFVQVMK